MNYLKDDQNRLYKKNGSTWYRKGKHGWEQVPDFEQVTITPDMKIIVEQAQQPITDEQIARIEELQQQVEQREKELLIHFAGLAMQANVHAAIMQNSMQSVSEVSRNAADDAQAMLDEIKKRGWL